MPNSIFTIGHSTHTIEQFIELLWRHRIGAVADVRRYPGSRRLPHFNELWLDEALAAESIRYVHFEELGGRREAQPGSPNTGWENVQFRGYADHMQSPEFASGVERLMALGAEHRTAVMCAEALWWRCHRRLLSDALVVRGVSVRHIGADGRLAQHSLTPFAVVDGLRLEYPAAQQSLNLPDP